MKTPSSFGLLLQTLKIEERVLTTATVAAPSSEDGSFTAAQATADLLAGRVALGFVNTSTTLPYVRQGRLRAIGVAERARLVVAPDIPTLDEAGLAATE